GRFVQGEMPTIDRSDDPDGLPPDLVLGAVPEVHTGRHPAADASLAETPHAIVERVFGVTLLQLRGRLDERFDPAPLTPHLKGRLLVDTSGVENITSYGIRGLLSLFEHAQTTSITHVRCSVPFIQQVGMVRMLLGGGSIVSFELPYVDPVNGNAFTVTLDGKVGERALRERKPPPWTCPGYPDRDARFDEHAESYLSFADAFTADPDPDLRAVIEGLAAEHRRREVEKGVDADGTHIWIRRPLQASFRWRNLLGGLEGRVHLDLEDTPSWTEEGVAALVRAIRKEAEAIESLCVTHAPRPLISGLLDAGLGERMLGSTGRVHAVCSSCGVPRRLALGFEKLAALHEGSPLDGRCPSCGGGLVSTEDFSELGPLPTETIPPVPVAEPVPTPTPDAGPPAVVWVALVVAVAVVIVVGWWLATASH
ncbi:MAG: hypothetical protein KC656_02855, partial [Myxococcales bacterium]|nr:hypothetical protein [Myxococcales bacterium]